MSVLNKWEKTGLLEGLEKDSSRQGMARLLENQAKQLLKEASSMAGGDVEGFASVAFPLVRRVFGGLLANDIVSVQPMSLPSGLIFFLDFTYTDSRGIGGAVAGDSIYGGKVVASQLTGGVDLGEEIPNASLETVVPTLPRQMVLQVAWLISIPLQLLIHSVKDRRKLSGSTLISWQCLDPQTAP